MQAASELNLALWFFFSFLLTHLYVILILVCVCLWVKERWKQIEEIQLYFLSGGGGGGGHVFLKYANFSRMEK